MSRWKHELNARLSGLNLGPQQRSELIEELAQHLDEKVAELVRSGATSDEAERAALVELDGPAVLRERIAALQDRRGASYSSLPLGSGRHWFSDRWQDLRYCSRSLFRSPGFTVAAILTLGLTIGPLTAVVTIGNWLLWRPAPGVAHYREVGLVSFSRQAKSLPIVSAMSHPNMDDIRSASRTLDQLVGLLETNASVVGGSLPAEEQQIAFVDAGFLGALGVRVVAGRDFQLSDDRPPHGAHVVILSGRLAIRSFGEMEQALGKPFTVNGRPLTVVGVADPTFNGVGPFSRVSAWIPGATHGYVNHFPPSDDVSRSRGLFRSFVGKLHGDATFDTARAELDVIVSTLVDRHPEDNGSLKGVRATVTPGLGLAAAQKDRYVGLVSTFVTIGGALLLLGCANMTNLMVMRSARSQRERSLRLALGAGRGRLVAIQFTECLLLAVSGGILGLILARGLSAFLATLLVPTIANWTEFKLPIDHRVLVATFGASVGCAFLAGLLPAFLSARTASKIGLHSRQRGGVGGGRRVRIGLAAVQLALSLALVTGAFLLIATLRNLAAVDLGFDPSDVSVHRLDASRHGYSLEQSLSYYERVLQLARVTPGVTAASLSATAYGSNREIRVVNPRGDSQAALRVLGNSVTSAYFDVLGIRIVAGRVFGEDETLVPPASSPNAVIINEALARQAFGETAAVGQRLVLRETKREVLVVGVVANARWNIVGAPSPELYLPFTSPVQDVGSAALLVKSALPAGRVNQSVQRLGAALDPTLPIRSAGLLKDEVDYKLRDQTAFAWVLSILGWVGLTLAAVGLYGIVAQVTAERVREFALRVALGSRPVEIFRLVFRQVAWIGAIGVVTGLLLGFLGSRLIEGYLFQVDRFDPALYGLAATVLVGVVVFASVGPALVAMRIEPMKILRTE